MAFLNKKAVSTIKWHLSENLAFQNLLKDKNHYQEKSFETYFGFWPRILKRDAKSYISRQFYQRIMYMTLGLKFLLFMPKKNIFGFIKKNYSDVLDFQL